MLIPPNLFLLPSLTFFLLCGKELPGVTGGGLEESWKKIFGLHELLRFY